MMGAPMGMNMPMGGMGGMGGIGGNIGGMNMGGM
jgi:hypothetical protein